VSSLKFGPGYSVATYQATAAWGQQIIRSPTSGSDPGQDFVVKDLGTVANLNQYGLVSDAFAARYGALEAYEFQCEPNGINSNYCTGTWPGEAAQPGFKVRLIPCGQSSGTIWAQYTGTPGGDTAVPGFQMYIAGATDNFSNPEVLNYPVGNPTDLPRPRLNVQPLSDYSNGNVFNNQQWATFTPPPPPPPPPPAPPVP